MRSSRFQLQSMARRWSSRPPSITSLVVMACAAIFGAQAIVYAVTADPLFESANIEALFGLHAESWSAGRPWQFFSFPFFHAGLLALIGNSLLLYFAGREVEPIIGSRQFGGVLMLATVLGGAAQWSAMRLGLAGAHPAHLGISAAVAAVVTAFATILPELDVTIFLLFVIPIRLRAKFLGLLSIAAAAGVWLWKPESDLGPVAMIVGSVAGWGYAKGLGFGNPTAIERYFRERRQHASRLERMPVDQFILEEIDPVLEKVARHGIGSLSRAERKLLKQGSDRLATPPPNPRSNRPSAR